MTALLETDEAAQRRPGRPRDESLEDRVLTAVTELIDEGATISVSIVVARSGVSRAAIYRRWATLDILIAAALDVGRTVFTPPEAMSVRDALRSGFPRPGYGLVSGFPEGRLRQRLLLALADTDLQHEYWKGHVSRRRVPLLALLERARDRGEVRTDVDLEAALDLLSGVFYYQVVARGASLADEATLHRCSAAMDIIWDGIAA